LKTFYLLFICFLCSCLPLLAQDLGSLGKQKPLTVTGSFSANAIGYSASGIANRRDPFYWLLSGNLNFSFYGVSIPVSATFSQQDRSFTQPFNQYGMSPHYKSVTLHLGYRSMNFSNYTLADNVFLGGGVEVAPAHLPLRVSMMYGRLAKPIAGYAVDGVITGQPSFERWGYGAKVSVGKLNRSIDLMLFRARDQEGNSSPSQSTGLRPAENLVLGIGTRQQLGERIFFDGEYALSAYSTDMNAERVTLTSFTYANHLGPLFTPNVSSQFNKAVLANLSYVHSLYQLKLSYRRIDPEYKTMGSVFLNNDLEDVSVGVAVQALKNRLSLSTSGGLQRNNLGNDLLARLTRVIGSVNANFQASSRLSLNASFSNFSTDTRMTLLRELDSLKYFQVTRSAGLGLNYNVGGDQYRHAVFLMGNYQTASDTQESGNRFLNANAGYQFGWLERNLTVSPSLNYNRNVSEQFSTLTYGPSLSVVKSFWQRKIRCNLAASLLNAYLSGNLISRNTNLRFATNYAPDRHHVISFDLTYLTRSPFSNPTSQIREFRGGILYTFIL
jgi:hypothetical protein